MSNKDEVVNVAAGSGVSSIQITINLGQPSSQSAQRIGGAESQVPMGVFIRQVVEEPGAAPVKKIRTSFIPDDLAQDASFQTADPDPGELSKWKELLGDRVSEIEIDSGDIVMRLDDKGGTVTWLPNDPNRDPVINRIKQKQNGGPGVSIGDFIQCWFDRGQTAAAASSCWSRL